MKARKQAAKPDGIFFKRDRSSRFRYILTSIRRDVIERNMLTPAMEQLRLRAKPSKA